MRQAYKYEWDDVEGRRQGRTRVGVVRDLAEADCMQHSIKCRSKAFSALTAAINQIVMNVEFHRYASTIDIG